MGQRDVNKSNEAPLAERLRERIRREGALTFRDWMAAALYDAQGGYYCRRDRVRWGRAGDYRTSPELSPLFAATFARYFTALHAELGSPEVLTIIEAGAGAGHFALGVMETLRRTFPHTFTVTRYLIDEASEDGRERARLRLAPYMERLEFVRLDAVETPLANGIIFANELLDAFPVHRVRVRGGRLLELYVGLDEAGDFSWAEREPSTTRLAAYFERVGVTLSEGQVAEVNLEAQDWLALAAAKLGRGYLILVDYGAQAPALYQASHRGQGTLRAFHQHKSASDPLARPGEQDLTTTVDWTNIIKAGTEAGLRVVSLERQDKFLLRAGLLDQLRLMTAATDSEAEAIALRSSVRELILPGGMSESFQVLVQKTGDE
ncbi:MAG TPA: SAM-dependent methyltransferase [Pyrinomonadaceae bacterium]|jgi:SAM-dependent MidA family methyltransferase|nr:SAM-dependent methyltransferase [Pyrinomonadaceae bacterium]